MTAKRRPTSRWFWCAAGLATATTVVVFFLLLLRVGGDTLTNKVDDLGELGAALFASACCVIAAVRRRRTRTAWTLLSISALSWGAGEAVWSYYELLRHVEVPFPGWADVGFLGAVPFAAAGLLCFPTAGVARTAARMQALLTGTLVGGSLLFVSWVTVLGPIFEHSHDGAASEIVVLAYPIGDVAIATLVVILFLRPGARDRSSLALVLAGMLALAVADTSFAYLTEVNSFGIGNALDTGWVAGYLLVGLGALRVLSAEETVPRQRRPTMTSTLGPYIPVAMAAAVFLWKEATSSKVSKTVEFLGFGLVCALAVRQLLALTENLALTRRLEARVEERTAELHHQAFHDGLTGLANRTLFNEELIAAVRRRSRSGAALALLFIDLDGFKQVNDLYGHGVGDRALQSVARRFRGTLRAADTLARLGGDEFAVLVEDDPARSNPEGVAQRLLASLDRPIRVGSLRLSLQASIGISTDRAGGETAEELRRNADLAMYTAKAARKHSYEVFAPEMHSDILERMRLTEELRNALDNEEFVLHFQPIVALASGRVEAVEALVRWAHPRRGLLSPAEFIPVAERTGLIVPIGAWVVQQACEQMHGLSDVDGFGETGLSVNLSPVQLAEGHVVETIAGALASSGLDPDRLTLEVTESVIIDDLDASIDVLVRLRQLGVKIAIDDFGTGYSSLSVLKSLPVDTLKIDRAFVTGIASSPESVTLAQRIIDLASDFNLRTVAEGVEGIDQLDVLRRLGCDAVQVFVYYRPLPVEALRGLPMAEGEAAAPFAAHAVEQMPAK